MFRLLLTFLATSSLLLAVAIPAPALAHPNPAEDLTAPFHFHGFAPYGVCPSGGGLAQLDECQTSEVFVWFFANWGNFMIGGVGAFALFFFVIGGFMMLISAGRAEMVQKGRAIIVGSVIGLIIVFAAYLFVTFFLKSIVNEQVGVKDLKVEIKP